MSYKKSFSKRAPQGEYRRRESEGRAGGSRGGGVDPITNNIIKDSAVILNKTDIEKFIKYSEDFGILCQRKRISTSQIRGIFTKIRKLSNNIKESKNDLNLLRPKLAYQKGRFEQLADLQVLLDHLIKNTKTDDNLRNFKEFFEAIICYHKAAGGKD